MPLKAETPSERRPEEPPSEMAAIDDVRTLDIDGTWARIEAVEGPGPDPVPAWEMPRSWSQRFIPRTFRYRRRAYMFAALFIALAVGLYFVTPWLLIIGVPLALLGIALWVGALNGSGKIRRSMALAEARKIWQSHLSRYQRWATKAAFEAERAELASKRDELRELLTTPRDTHPKFVELSKRGNRYTWLASFGLDDATIPELSKSSRAILRKASVLTAAEADPDTVKSLLKTRPKAVKAIRQWRREIVRGYDPRASVEPSTEDIRDAIADFSEWQRMLVRTYQSGPEQLAARSRAIVAGRANDVRNICELWEELQVVERRHRRRGLPEPDPEPPTRRRGSRRKE